MQKTDNTIYQFKIVLKGINPKIWRRIQVPSNFTMHQLHCAIIDSMNWIDGKLYHFDISKLRRQHSYVGVQLKDCYVDNDVLCSMCVNIGDFFKRPMDKIIHSYDYKRGWQFEVLFQRILPKSIHMTYPRCVSGAGASPPRDCKGMYHFARLLEKCRLRSNRNSDVDSSDSEDGSGSKSFDPDNFEASNVVFIDEKDHFGWNDELGRPIFFNEKTCRRENHLNKFDYFDDYSDSD